MTRYVTCDVKGPAQENYGLGNQLFCIATTLAYSKKHNIKYALPQLKEASHGNYINNIFSKLETNFDIVERLNFIKIQETGFEYTQLPFYENYSILLDGYFQSEKYFIDYRDYIIKNLNLIDIKKNLSNKYSNLDKFTSLHIRRGDYLNKQQYHNILNLQYYKNALKLINNENILIFSDDIEWCKQNLNFINNKIFATNQYDYEDLILMSMCKNNIIANSSFSWWGAWLNENTNKLVVAPKEWFGPAYSQMLTNDLIPESWNRI